MFKTSNLRLTSRWFDYCKLCKNAGRSKSSYVENDAKFRTFSPPVKIRGGVGEISELRFKASPRTKPRI